MTLLCGSVGTAAAAQQPLPAPAEEVTAPDKAVAVAPVARDDQIDRRITEILRSTGWFQAPRVEVRDGVVFLDGTTGSEDHRNWARDLAAKTQDVVAVVNRIAVRQEVQWTFAPAMAEIERLGRQAIAMLPLIALALIVLPMAWYASRLVHRLSMRALRTQVASVFLRDVIARAIALPTLLLGIYIVLQVAGLTRLALSLIGGAGVLGIVIGFAFRDIAENFLASLLLSIRQPFRAGDFVEVAGFSGLVQSMNTRSTILLSLEGNHIQIPNATIFKSSIVNYTAAPQRREVLEVGIGYDASVSDVQDIILRVLKDHEAVTNEPPPMVLVDTLGSSTVNLKVYYWFDGHRYSELKVRSALLRLVKAALIEAGISMPDDAREIIFPEGVPLVQAGPTGAATAADLAAAKTARQQEVARVEPDAPATESEDRLENESADLEAQAGAGGAAIPEGRTDLLR
ncbi:MAG: mechanosensitive ion channel [Alphaproteobacteria bacterium]|nr:mechanosensitive ion channel [Alphaproteobacteria bacterium]MCB9930266.1 mechanosensitive ion channel [Alphaproteobacteria bacterium]